MLSSVTRGGARSVPIAVGFGDEPSTCRFMASMSVLLPEDRATTVLLDGCKSDQQAVLLPSGNSALGRLHGCRMV